MGQRLTSLPPRSWQHMLTTVARGRGTTSDNQSTLAGSRGGLAHTRSRPLTARRLSPHTRTPLHTSASCRCTASGWASRPTGHSTASTSATAVSGARRRAAPPSAFASTARHWRVACAIHRAAMSWVVVVVRRGKGCLGGNTVQGMRGCWCTTPQQLLHLENPKAAGGSHLQPHSPSGPLIFAPTSARRTRPAHRHTGPQPPPYHANRRAPPLGAAPSAHKESSWRSEKPASAAPPAAAPPRPGRRSAVRAARTAWHSRGQRG